MIIVGAGVFGCVIAETFRRTGLFDITMFDHRDRMNGSIPSGFLMKPSWITMMNKRELDECFRLLDTLYGVRDIQLTVWPTSKKVTAHHLDRNKVLYPEVPVIEKTVLNIHPAIGAVVYDTPERAMKTDIIIVAAGYWTNELLRKSLLGEIKGFHGKQGVSFVYKGHCEPFIRPWAPYKQIVAHEHCNPGEIWVGDGTAIKPENWTQERQLQTETRIAVALPDEIRSQNPIRQYGIRSFVKGHKPCYLEHIGATTTWVVAGGGKNGTIAAAWAANRLMEEIL